MNHEMNHDLFCLPPACSSWSLLGTDPWLEEVMARDPLLSELASTLRRLAVLDAPVLIHGPEALASAWAIHHLSARAAEPFVIVDCSRLPEPLLEAELRGAHDPGFGRSHKEGSLRQAGGGTVLLLEVGMLPRRLQSTLLGVLERGEIVPLGSAKPLAVRARCLASTSAALAAEALSPALRARLSTEVLSLPGGSHEDEELAASPTEVVDLREHERRYIAHVLREANGNQQRAAAMLGISRWTLARRLRRYGLRP